MPTNQRRKADEHEQPDLDLVHRHADGPRALQVAADREDPVADAGLEQHVGGDEREQDPPEHGDPDRDAADVERGREDLLGRIEALPCRTRSRRRPAR